MCHISVTHIHIWIVRSFIVNFMNSKSFKLWDNLCKQYKCDYMKTCSIILRIKIHILHYRKNQMYNLAYLDSFTRRKSVLKLQ